jgi:hypothetical protein
LAGHPALRFACVNGVGSLAGVAVAGSSALGENIATPPAAGNEEGSVHGASSVSRADSSRQADGLPSALPKRRLR